MFTGIVSDIGTIEAVEARGDTRIRIATAYDTAGIDLGASIACSGVCLTVIDTGPGWFAVQVSGETIARTARDQWTQGRRLNLERAMKLGDELGGHIVTAMSTASPIRSRSRPRAIRPRVFALPAALAPFVATKGSITIDGVSLTVNGVEDDGATTRFWVNIIPHTQAVTTLGGLAEGAGGQYRDRRARRFCNAWEHYRGR